MRFWNVGVGVAVTTVVAACGGAPVMAETVTSRWESPYGMYTGTVTPDLIEFQSKGAPINMTVTYGLPGMFNDPSAVVKTLAALDAAFQNQFKLVLNLSIVVLHPELKPYLPDFIGQVKTHPGLYGYYLYDEPELTQGVDVAGVKQLADSLKSLDSIHPTLQVFSVYFDLARPYFGIADIEGFDYYFYSVSDENTRQGIQNYYQLVNEFVESHEAIPVASNRTKAYWIVPPAFVNTYNRVYTENELAALIDNTYNLSPLYSGVLYYTWQTGITTNTPLSRLPAVQTTIAQVGKRFRDRGTEFPVRFVKGDLDNNYVVDFVDTQYLMSIFGGPASVFNDFNANALSDIFDYSLWTSTYGTSQWSPPPIPPPASGMVYPMIESSVSRTVVPAGTKVQVACDYNQVLDCIGMGSSGLSSCTYVGFSGTAALFDCQANAVAGTYPVSCMTYTGTSKQCAYTHVSSKNVTVNTTIGAAPPLKSGGLSQTALPPSTNLTVTCDYGQPLDCVGVKSTGLSNCFYTQTIGTAHEFTCTTGVNLGSFNVACSTHQGTPHACASTETPIHPVYVVR